VIVYEACEFLGARGAMRWDVHETKEKIRLYQESDDPVLGGEILFQFNDLINSTCDILIRNRPFFYEREDMRQEMMMALLVSVKRYDCSGVVKPLTYFYQRVRGSGLDYMRKENRADRGTFGRVKVLDEFVESFYKVHGEVPHLGLVVEGTGLSEEVVVRTRKVYKSTYFVSVEDDGVFLYGRERDPLDLCEVVDSYECLERRGGCLSGDERFVFVECFVKGVQVMDVAEVLGLSSSRVSQIKRSAVDSYVKALKKEHRR